MKTTKRTLLGVAVAAALGTAGFANANTGQSSAMRGTIVGPQGNPAAASTITIIHEPSGTVKKVSVNENGLFTARGLRVGGPYRVIIASDKFQGQIIENVFLDLNDTLAVNSQLETRQDLETITVTGARDFFSNNGANSVFGEDDIENAPAFNRDIKDIVRNNPLAVVDPTGDTLSIAGSNPKFNSFSIDGVGVNDTFGLQNNGYPTSRPPISLDAVEQIGIEFAPFNARSGNFGGGAVNVVTKSGTNEFTGTVFFETVPWLGDAEDDKLHLEDDGSATVTELVNEEESYGFSVGGPILEDKLFFFATYEHWEEEVQFDYNLNTLSNHDVNLDDANRVLNILSNTYGLTDSIGASPAPNEDEKIIVKLDWNINQDHRADFTFSSQDSSEARNYTEDEDQLNFASNLWTSEQTNTFVTAHLYSEWNAELQTEISVSFKDFKQASATASNWGEVNILTGSGDIVLGQDENRHANVLENETLNIGVHATYLADFVEYRFGAEIEDTWNFNLYGRDAAGTWEFDSIDDFESKTVSSFEYGNAYTNNINDIAYDVSSTKFSVYGDATFDLTDDIEVTAGLRYEYISIDDKPQLNANFENTYGFSNTENLDGSNIFLPRVSFNWFVNEDVTVRGGVGRYTGGTPLVWLSNAYTNDGVTKDSVELSTIDPSEVDFTKVPASAQGMLAQGAGSTNQIDPDFELPSDWRYQIAADVTFDIPGIGENFAWTTELNYVDRENSAYWIDLSRKDNGKRTADGGRVIWDSVYEGTDFEGNYDLQLTNSDDGGRSIIWVTSLANQWDNGFSMNMSYTNQDITEANPGTSSTAESNFQYEVTTNRGTPEVGTAYYEIEHRLVLNLGYETQFFDGYDTNFNLFFERRSGRPFSWTLGAFRDGDLGDQGAFDDSDIYLPYIPTGADDPAVDFGSGLSYAEMQELIALAGLEGSAGGYGEKYTGSQPWVTTMDLYISQEIPGIIEGHKGKIYFSIDNFANLLNSDWGKVYDIQYPQNILFDYDVNDAGQYVYRTPYGKTFGDTSDWKNYTRFHTAESAYRIKVGVKYSF